MSDSMASNQYVRRQPVRFDAVDSAGLVYYPHFLALCHDTFEDWITECGPLTYPTLICEQGVGYPTVAINGEFKASLTYGDTALIALRVSRIGKSSLACRYEISRERDGAPCFVGDVVTVFMDLKRKVALPHPPEMREFFARFSAES